MKKQLLLILALLAFILPARAAQGVDPDMLYNFRNNSSGTEQGTKLTTGTALNDVFGTTVGTDVGNDYGNNATNYISAINEANNVYYNSKGGIYMKAGGKLTFTLKKSYKVKEYQFMGQRINNTTANITLNGITFSGPTESLATGLYSRLYPTPTSVTDVQTITITSDKDVYIKSVGIYIESDGSELTVNVAPQPGNYDVGQTVMAMASNSSATVQMTVDKVVNGNHSEVYNNASTSSNSFTFSEAGEYFVTAQAYTGNWATWSDYFSGTYIIGDDSPATLSIDKPTGTYTLPLTINLTSTKANDAISVTLKDKEGQNVVDVTATGSWTYTFNTPGVYKLEAFNEDLSEINEDYTIKVGPCPLEITPASGTIAPGTEIKVSSILSDAILMVTLFKDDSQTFEDFVDNPYTFTPTEPGVYKISATASYENYFDTDKTATYTVKAPVIPTVAPKISFSHEDQKVFGSNEEIDVTLSLNSDVYPVPEVIYYTLDGYSAHNTIEAGQEGASPEGKILTVNVDPTTLSGVVRIIEDHRTALQHRAVTVNAYAVNTAGSDVAAATYIFNDDSKPEPSTVTAVVTMANQGWTTGSSPYTAKNSFTTNWESDKIEALDNATLTFETTATSEGSSYPAFNSQNSPYGLRFYSTSTNNNTITVKVPDNSYRFASVTFIATNTLKVNGTSTASGKKVDLTDKPTEIVFASDVTSTMAVSKVEFVLEKVSAKAASVRRAAATDVFNLVTDASQIKAGDEIIIASHYYKTGNSAKDSHYVLKSFGKDKGTGVEDTSLNKDNSKLAAGQYLVFTVESDGTKATDGTDAYLLKNGSNYLTGKKDNNGLSLAAKSDLSYLTITNGGSGWGDNAMNVHFINCGAAGNLMCNSGTSFNSYKDASCSDRTVTNDLYSNVILYRKADGGDPGMETVATPVITVSAQAQPTDAVTVSIACGTEGATVKYTINEGAEQTYTASFTVSDPGSYTINAHATKDGMNNSANATPATFTIAKPARVPEAVEELFLVLEKNIWNIEGNAPETVVPFVYNAEQGYYDLEISTIPATGTYAPGTTDEETVNGGFMGEFYVRDGKANNNGLVFAAEVAAPAPAGAPARVAPAAQPVVKGTVYNMTVKPADATSFAMFTTKNIAHKTGTIRVTYTPGKKDASEVKTLQILNSETTTAIDAIEADTDAPVEYYNLQGLRIANPQQGQIVIRRQGNNVEKILF